MFVGRQRELGALDACYRGEHHFKIVTVEGRKGAGKSALCARFLAGKHAIGVLDAPSTHAQANIDAAVACVIHELGASPTTPVRASWGDFFECVVLLAQKTGKRPLLYVDDYPLVVKADADFVSAFSAALGQLRKCFAFILLNGEKSGFDAVGRLARIDDSLALCSTKVIVHPLGYQMAVAEAPQSIADLVDYYAAQGGVPLAGGRPRDPISEIEAWGSSVSPEGKALARLLASAANPYIGLDEKTICDELSLKPIAFKRCFNELRGCDIAASVRLYDCAAADSPWQTRYRLVNHTDVFDNCQQDSAMAPCKPKDGALRQEASLEMLRQWVWDTGRDGTIPFEFDKVSFLIDSSRGAGCPTGVIATSVEAHAAFVCRYAPCHERTQAFLEELADINARLPFKHVHHAAVLTEPPGADTLDFAQDRDDVTIVEMTPQGFSVALNAWQLHSERYQNAMREAAERRKCEQGGACAATR